MNHEGLLFIGDPHLASRTPGFRKDDYPTRSLEKLRWSVQYARDHGLWPILLGDLFHWPRDNANWLIAELMAMLAPDILCVAGNHDCHGNALNTHDSLHIILQAERLTLLDAVGPQSTVIDGQTVVVGGTSWGQDLPKAFDPSPWQGQDAPVVFWVTHHDIRFPGYVVPGSIMPYGIPGVDVVINGHIHERLAPVVRDETMWLNPGNITRLSRDRACREHRPAVLQVLFEEGTPMWDWIEVPHERFEDVFFEVETSHTEMSNASAFVQGLAELLMRRTESGAGLAHFLDHNLDLFSPRVAEEIRALALEVLPDDHPWRQKSS